MRLLILTSICFLLSHFCLAKDPYAYSLKELNNGNVNLKKVKRIFVSRDTLLYDIPDIVFKCKNLEDLHLINCRIKSIPDKIELLIKLKVVSLSGNKIKSVPPALFLLKNLRELYIDNNILQIVPDEINNLKKLKQVDLSSNKITILPESLTLPDLETLSIYNNPLSEVKTNFNAPRLYSLSLAGCSLSEFPGSILKLQNLGLLFLEQNSLKSLPIEINLMPKLQIMFLDFNLFAEIPDVLRNNKRLTELSISNNKIASIDSLVVKTNIKVLNASHNYITEIPSYLAQMNSLEYLSLKCNKITELPEFLIATMANLNTIDLSCNNILLFSEPKELLKKEIIITLNRNASLLKKPGGIYTIRDAEECHCEKH